MIRERSYSPLSRKYSSSSPMLWSAQAMFAS